MNRGSPSFTFFTSLVGSELGMYLNIPIIDRLPGERPGSMSPWHGPVKVGKLLLTLEKFDFV
jgi:hypothetical protein